LKGDTRLTPIKAPLDHVVDKGADVLLYVSDLACRTFSPTRFSGVLGALCGMFG